MIRAAIASADMLPSEMNALEMHGTGTALGDPIEIGAVCAALEVKLSASEALLSEVPVHQSQIDLICLKVQLSPRISDLYQ